MPYIIIYMREREEKRRESREREKEHMLFVVHE